MHKRTTRWMTWLTLLALCLSLLTLPALAAEEAAYAAEAGAGDAAVEEVPLVNIVATEAELEAAEADASPETEPDPAEPPAPADVPAAEVPSEAGTPAEGEASEEGSEEPATDGAPTAAQVVYMNGEEILAQEEVAVGEKPAQVPTADGAGRAVRAWLDAEGNRVVPADTVIEADTVFYAWFAPVLRTADHIRYINGTGNARFQPTSDLTRAQAATILYQLLDSQAKGPFNDSFTDVSDTAWYSTAVKTLASVGVINGYTDGSFRPNRSVTRAEFVTMLVNLTGVTGSDAYFTDIDTHWAKNAIYAAASQGWINGYLQSNGTYMFRPGRNITRAEAVVVMNRVLGRVADRGTIDSGDAIRHFIDVKSTDWWYYDVMEASIGHSHTRGIAGEVWTTYNVESTELSPGLHKVGADYVLCNEDSQPVYMRAGLNFAEGIFCYAASAGYTFTADLSSRPGYAVFASGLTDQALTNGFNQIGTTLFYWDLNTASAMRMGEGLNDIGNRTYWADEEGYNIRNDFGAGVVSLGGKKYLADSHCAIITRGLAYADDTSLPATMDLRGKTFEYEGNMYYVHDDYSLAANEWVGYLYFGADARYTSGDSELDAMVYDIVKDFVDNNALTHEQKLLRAYYYLRGGSGATYVDNGFRYLPVGNIFYKGRYNEQAFNGYFADCAKQMYTKNYGRCYEWGAGYLYLARRLGFQAYLVVGGIGNVNTVHCWNMIYWSGRWHISDVEIEWGWLAGYYGGGYRLYRNLFNQTLSSEWVTYYVNPETSTVSYYFP